MNEFLSNVKTLPQRARLYLEQDPAQRTSIGGATLTSINRERVKAQTSKAKDLADVWLRERKEALARQLAANAEIKQRWLASNPIEISQQQCGYHASATVQSGVKTEKQCQ